MFDGQIFGQKKSIVSAVDVVASSLGASVLRAAPKLAAEKVKMRVGGKDRLGEKGLFKKKRRSFVAAFWLKGWAKVSPHFWLRQTPTGFCVAFCENT